MTTRMGRYCDRPVVQEPSWLSMDSDSILRCQAALTHPVTIVAVGVLLLNGLLLKALWPSPWTTGKLSDLAWVVFASPLLALLLSLAVPRRSYAERTVFGVAYFGLPLPYVAFNTLERLWRTVKYEEAYLKAYSSATEARRELGDYFRFYNDLRPHQALGYRTPAEVFHGEQEVGEESNDRRCSPGTGSVLLAGAPGPSLSSALILSK